jgi:germination protein M
MRKKGVNPILKFTLVIILMAAAGFLIFYSIDNPDFWKNIFTSSSGDQVEEEAVSSPAETVEGQTVNNTEGSVTLNGFGENGAGDLSAAGTEGGNPEDGNSSTPSIWQRIIDFLRGELNDEKEEKNYPEKLELNFYFSGLGEEEKLVSEKRTIIAGNSEIAVKNAVAELLKGPAKSYHFPVIPAGTELISAETYENIAKIDLSQEFLDESLDSRILDEHIIYSIVNTLTEIPEIEGVIFYIEGTRVKVYGNIDLSIPAIRNNEYIEEQ